MWSCVSQSHSSNRPSLYLVPPPTSSSDLATVSTISPSMAEAPAPAAAPTRAVTPKLALFDLDGTLIEAFLEEVECPTCHGDRYVLQCQAGRQCFDEEEMPCTTCRATGKKLTHIRDYEQVTWLPNRLAVLSRLAREGVKLGIVTNQTGVAFGYQTADQVARKLGVVRASLMYNTGVDLDPKLTQVAMHSERGEPPWNDPEECKLRKPQPFMLYRAMAEAGVGPESTFFVGDLPVDQQAAENAHVAFFWAHEFFAPDMVHHSPPQGEAP